MACSSYSTQAAQLQEQEDIHAQINNNHNAAREEAMVLEAVRLSTQDEAARRDEAEVTEAVRRSSQDDALRRAFRRDPPPVALALCRDGGRAAPTHDESDPWRAATDAAGRQYFYHSSTRETRWTRPELAADWISDAVLSAVGDVRAPAPRQALDTTISHVREHAVMALRHALGLSDHAEEDKYAAVLTILELVQDKAEDAHLSAAAVLTRTAQRRKSRLLAKSQLRTRTTNA